MLPRNAVTATRTRLRDYPGVALVGPRQSGKTTLARTLGGAYFDLEQEADRLRLDLHWRRHIEGTELIVLDEAQAWPELFPRLRGAIDGDRSRNGRFLLLGSIAPALMVQVSQSLAGRLSLMELTPLLRGELPDEDARRRHWLVGGYPDGGVLHAQRYPRWQLDYLALLAQRDLPEWGLAARPSMTDRLFRMVAALHARPWNASQVGAGLGLSYHTVNSYIEHFEGAFLVRRLPAYLPNLGKRLIKRSKVQWRDSGLLHALLNVPDERTLLGQPWVAASWEGYVVEQTIGQLQALGVPFEPYWFRTSDGKEIDLVLELGGERWAIGIKLTSAPRSDDMRKLDVVADLIGADRRVLVSHVDEPAGDLRRASTHVDGLLEMLREQAGRGQ